jgi:hypothetical protein
VGVLDSNSDTETRLPNSESHPGNTPSFRTIRPIMKIRRRRDSCLLRGQNPIGDGRWSRSGRFECGESNCFSHSVRPTPRPKRYPTFRSAPLHSRKPCGMQRPVRLRQDGWSSQRCKEEAHGFSCGGIRRQLRIERVSHVATRVLRYRWLSTYSPAALLSALFSSKSSRTTSLSATRYRRGDVSGTTSMSSTSSKRSV